MRRYSEHWLHFCPKLSSFNESCGAYSKVVKGNNFNKIIVLKNFFNVFGLTKIHLKYFLLSLTIKILIVNVIYGEIISNNKFFRRYTIINLLLY